MTAIFNSDRMIIEADSTSEAKNILIDHHGIDLVHLDFLVSLGKNTVLGGVQKLREFYFEVVRYDLQFNTDTSGFISENEYAVFAQSKPESLADPSTTKYGVKYRASLTSSVELGINFAVQFLNGMGIKTEAISFVDLGCGTGKAVLIAANSFKFRCAYGVDYYSPLIDTAHRNRANFSEPLLCQDIHFLFSNVVEFAEYKGVNILYLYNPFGEEIMRQVEDRISKYGGRTLIVYTKPICRDIFEAKGWKCIREVRDLDADKHIVWLFHEESFRGLVR